MRKAYRITGSSFEKPANLPEGFVVKERLVGDSLTVEGFRGGNLTFQEVKDGSVVLFKEGQSGSQLHFRAEDIEKIFRFLGDVAVQQTKCPGTPHRGHTSSHCACPRDYA